MPSAEPHRESIAGHRVQLRVMCGFELRVDRCVVTAPTNVARVLAFLAVRDRPQLRQTVATHLWIDSTEDRASANLRTALWRGRQLLGDWLISEGSYLALAPEVGVDLRMLVDQAHRLFRSDAPLTEGDTDPGTMTGDLLPDWDEEWIVFERERLRQLRVHALEALCTKLSAAGRAGEAVDVGLMAVAAEPLRESAQRLLVGAYLAEGNVSEARRQYHLYRELLWDALGIEPSDELRSLVGLNSGAATRR